ncbi:MAG: PAS domain-containing sensor histidine kinase [Candidatus Jacksonbacteria bacterium]|nr:PAS domain-containing sensor histidine kinase [Candidatus Jacksonbacteria bacterium]
MQLTARQFDNIFSSMSEGLIVLDKNCRITVMNQAAAILLRIAPADAVLKDVESVFPVFRDLPGTFLTREFVERVINDFTILHFHFKDNLFTKDKNGAIVPIVMDVAPLLEGEEVIGAVMFFRDITAEKEFARAKSEFLSLASHQLRNPLTTARWYLELIMSKAKDKLTKKDMRCLTRVYESNERMVELVGQMLEVSGIELGEVVVNPKQENISLILKEVITELEDSAKGKQVAVKTRFSTIPPIKVDHKITCLIFHNLICYGIHFASPKSVLYLSLEKKGENAIFTMSDSETPAFGPAKIVKMQMFHIDRDALGTEAHSTGLELYIARALTETSGGEIWMSQERSSSKKTFFDKQNKTAFSVLIPLSGMRKKGNRP